jgi:PIN domain nuclease of toxin-antitoxin system
VTYFPDTHSLVWYLAGSSRLPQVARDALAEPSSRMVVPAIVLAEIHFLHARGRVSVSLQTVLSFVSSTARCAIQPLDESVIRHLPAGLDIHDALIVATAIMYRDDRGESVALITRDADIRTRGLVPVVGDSHFPPHTLAGGSGPSASRSQERCQTRGFWTSSFRGSPIFRERTYSSRRMFCLPLKVQPSGMKPQVMARRG